MKRKYRNNKLAQTVIGYIVLIAVLVAAFSALAGKIRQRTQASYKESADVFGEGRQLNDGAELPTPPALPKFIFPILPGGGGTGGVDPNPIDPDCDLAALESLRNDSIAKQQRAAALATEAGDARILAANAEAAAATAMQVAYYARQAANRARQDANNARQAADHKQAECNNCNAGNQGCTTACINCTPICAAVAGLKQIATNAENLAAEMERIADEKEAIYRQKRAEADALNAAADAKDQAAAQAAAEAETASNALLKANEACYSGGGGGGGGGGCFLKGTKVALADGTNKPIEEIKIGDMVLGYDGKQVKAGKVTKTFFHPKTKGYRVISTEEGQQINVTDIHPLFNGKTYVVASRFKVGDNLFLLKDNKLQAVKIKSIEVKDSINDVYNLHIEKLNTYFAEGILCHNKPPVEI